MATFQYIATDSSGKEVRGTVDAGDRNSAISAVRAQGLLPKALGEVKSQAQSSSSPAASPAAKSRKAPKAPASAGGKKKGLGSDIKINFRMPKFLQGRIKTKVLTQFTRQLATLVNAGLPLMRGIDVLKRQMKDPQMQDALNGISENIAAGGTFSEALTAYPKIFDKLYVNMVKAGEAGGVLEVVLGRLAEFAEKSEKIKNKVKGAMIYPCVVLVAAVGITWFLLVMVIPKFKQVFNDMLGGAALPTITEVVIQASEFMQHNGLLIGAVVVSLIVVVKLIGKTEKGAYLFDAIKLKMPVTGTLAQRSAVSKFTRTLGTLLSSGVPILQSLTITRDTTGNRVLTNAIQSVHDAVKEGESMTQPLAQCKVFPPMVVSMVEVGEETGALADMLTRIANTYDDEVDNAVAGMTAAIEPALIIVLAVVVGTIVIAMFLPMIKIISSVSGAAG
ncbi:MAG: type II secretion system F family protein [Kiritimatiellae bacterium]|nr:type II secretion system F family protein [Kiritimatiellia bacterium]